MNITISKRNGGWIFLLLLFIVVVIVATVVLVGLYHMAKRVNDKDAYVPKWDDVWYQTDLIGSNLAYSVGASNWEYDQWVTNALPQVPPKGFGVGYASTDGGNTWTQEMTFDSLDAAVNWEIQPSNIDRSIPMKFWRIDCVVTNQP